ncbi:hypothetical protein MRX96_001938 [Rhipicephalus microplus]
MTCENIYRDVCGLHLSYIFQEPVVREALTYKPKPGDVFVVSFPKSGSTWMQQIVYAIYHDGTRPENLQDFMAKSPFLELVGLEAIENMERPGAIKTHLPFNRVPYYPQAKQLLSWYDHIDDDNVLFVTYEKLKLHTSEEVIKIADFLGEKYGERLRSRPDILERILNTISAKTMAAFNDEFRKWTEEAAALTSSQGGEMDDNVKKPMTGDFVRKAIVGDWKNHFNSKQIKRMKETITSKVQGSSVMRLWEDGELP